jgi:hypothetical protein
VHSDSDDACEERIEAPAEARASDHVRRWGEFYADTANQITVEEGADGGLWLGGPDFADSHAEERGGKRLRTSASGHDAWTPSR